MTAEVQSRLERPAAPDPLAAVAAAIDDAPERHRRALIIRNVVETLTSAVAAAPDATTLENDSLVALLDAVDEHCWRMATLEQEEDVASRPFGR